MRQGFSSFLVNYYVLTHPIAYKITRNIVGSNVVFNFQLIKKKTLNQNIISTFVFIAASTRGTNTDGAVPKDTLIIFAIGGYTFLLFKGIVNCFKRCT